MTKMDWSVNLGSRPLMVWSDYRSLGVAPPCGLVMELRPLFAFTHRIFEEILVIKTAKLHTCSVTVWVKWVTILIVNLKVNDSMSHV